MRLEPYNELLTEEYFLDVGNNIQAHQIVLGSLSEDLPAAIHSFEENIQECLIKFAYTGQLDDYISKFEARFCGLSFLTLRY